MMKAITNLFSQTVSSPSLDKNQIDALYHKVLKLFKDNNYSDYSDILVSEEGVVAVSIEWGDWKHDHAYVKHLMTHDGDFSLLHTRITEDDDSDTYSATHYFK